MLAITIDWLQFTASKKCPLDTIIQLLHLNVNTFKKLDRGRMGYKQQMCGNNISILYDGNEGMNAHVILSGEACRLYSINNSLIELLGRINNSKSKVTRIDLAIDDKKGDIINLNKIRKDIIDCNVISKWKTSLEMIKRSLSEHECLGYTMNIGSRSSEMFLRIYDKSKEQNIEGKWARMELEIKGKKAEIIQYKITEDNIGYLAKTLINNYIRIVEPNEKDTNRARWKNKKYWDKLIGTTEKTRLSVDKNIQTVEGAKEWLTKQVAPTIATVVSADSGSTDFLYELIADGIKRLNPKQREMIKKEIDKVE